MEQTHKTLDPDRPKPSSLNSNGTLKKTHIRNPHPSRLYRECLKNHAASLGGHALDGCGEFMPSPSSNPSDPCSLTCAACGCHRNFHRRLTSLPQREEEEEKDEDFDYDDRVSTQNDDGDDSSNRAHSASPPPPSATHMLLALSTGHPSGPTPPPQQQQVGVGVAPPPRKRFRTKFSPEQKERMQELSERLGWRMQRRDEGLVEDCCKEIGVGKGVFKVWMHNNKHNFVGGSKRAASAATNGGGGIENLGMTLNGSASSSSSFLEGRRN